MVLVPGFFGSRRISTLVPTKPWKDLDLWDISSLGIKGMLLATTKVDNAPGLCNKGLREPDKEVAVLATSVETGE